MSIIAQQTSIANLIEKSAGCTKVKLFDCHLGASAKFYNGSVETVTLSEGACDQFTAWLKQAPGFTIEPMVTSGGLTAKRK